MKRFEILTKKKTLSKWRVERYEHWIIKDIKRHLRNRVYEHEMKMLGLNPKPIHEQDVEKADSPFFKGLDSLAKLYSD